MQHGLSITIMKKKTMITSLEFTILVKHKI